MLNLLETFSLHCGFSKLMQRIFKQGNIPNTSLASDEELNILIVYRSFFYVIMCMQEL